MQGQIKAYFGAFVYDTRLFLLLFLLMYVNTALLYAQEKASKALENPQKQIRDQRQVYEDEITVKLLHRLKRKLHPQPQGLSIHQIQIVRLEVFLEDEPIWLQLNRFHPTTKEWVIQQELRFQKKDSYQDSLVLESERNLRNIGILSSVDIVAVEPIDMPQCQCVDVLVITRDLWSLRLESMFSFNGGIVDQLRLALVERNLLGHRQNLQLRAFANPFKLSSGISLSHGRFWKNLSASIGADIDWNRVTQKKEGHQFGFEINRPIYHLDQSWSFVSSFALIEQIARRNIANRLLTYDDAQTPQNEAIPLAWKNNQIELVLGIQRQLIDRTLDIPRQYRFSISAFAFEYQNHLPSRLNNAQVKDWTQNIVGVNRKSFGFSMALNSFKREFITLKNISTFGISEDLNLGLGWGLSSGYSILDQVWSNQASIGWTGRWGNSGFVAGATSLSARYQVPFIREENSSTQYEPNQRQWVNRVLSMQLKMASPVFGIGRLVALAMLQSRWLDQNREFMSLGGSNGLRGYQSQAFSVIGGDYARFNMEYRTLAWHYSFFHLGLVAFLDIGGIGQKISSLSWHEGAGAGLRIFLPQFNHGVFRLDWATPLDQNGFTVLLSAGSDQAFALMPWE